MFALKKAGYRHCQAAHLAGGTLRNDCFSRNLLKVLKSEFPWNTMYGRGIIDSLSLNISVFIPRAVQMLPKLNLKPLITVYPMKEVVKAFGSA